MKHGTFYSNYLKGTVKQVNKATAEKLFKDDETIYVQSCNLIFDNVWQRPCDINKEGYSYVGISFDSIVNSYICYNCDNVRGRYPNFFVVVGNQSISKNKFVKGVDFMGNDIYWLNGLSMEMSTLSDTVCCIYKNAYYTDRNGSLRGEKKYICEITLPPYHEDKVTHSFMYIKDAKKWAITEICLLNNTYWQ